MGRTYREFLKEKLNDPEFKKEWDEMESGDANPTMPFIAAGERNECLHPLRAGIGEGTVPERQRIKERYEE